MAWRTRSSISRVRTTPELRVCGQPRSRIHGASRPMKGNRANPANALSGPVSSAVAYGSSNRRRRGGSALSTARNRAMYSAVRLGRSPVLNGLAVRIQELQFAKVQLPYAGFDLGPVSHHHPHQMIRAYDVLGGGFNIGNLQGPHAAGVLLVVVVRQAVFDQFFDGAAHLTHGFARTRQAQGFVGLDLCQLLRRGGPLAQNIA